jgi:hypothetical protein
MISSLGGATLDSDQKIAQIPSGLPSPRGASPVHAKGAKILNVIHTLSLRRWGLSRSLGGVASLENKRIGL